MKNLTIVTLMIFILAAGMISAQGIGAQVGVNARVNAGDNNSDINSNINKKTVVDVEGIQITAQNRNEIRNRYNGNASFMVNVSQGTNARVKVMPDTASEIALSRLRLRVCSEENNCTIILKDTGERNNNTVQANTSAELRYEVRAEKQVRVLGLFRSKMNVQANVDAETGEVIKIKKPWWAFLASETETSLNVDAESETEGEVGY